MNIASVIDHTILKPSTTVREVRMVCQEADRYHFAAVCLPPFFVKEAKTFLVGSNVKVATVIGFPFGYSAVQAKMAEIEQAIQDGADELDVVINVAALKCSDWQYLGMEIDAILPLVHHPGRKLKAIIESGILTDEEIIKCCELYGAAGVDYLKTSTGFAERGASVEAVALMKKNLPETVAIKASGGIRTYPFAVALLEAGASRLGCTASMAIISGETVDEGIKY